MSYIKNGIVTRIEIKKNRKDSAEYINKYFNIKLFNQNNNTYLLKHDMLKNNLISFREELLILSEGKCDSLDNCEAYCLEININKMLENEIYLTKDNKKFYFQNYENMKFDTDSCIYNDGKIIITIFFIPIIWDINKIIAEDFNSITTIVNNLTRKAMKNTLKDASWFTVI